MLTLRQLPATQRPGVVRNCDVSVRAVVQATPARLGDVNATINAVFDRSPTDPDAGRRHRSGCGPTGLAGGYR
jgi:hypothetical protein